MDFPPLLAEGTVFSSAQYWVLLATSLLFGLYMAWSIGANDVANAMGTSVGSRALTLKQAIIVAGILEFAGAFLVGPHVSETIRKNIIPFDHLAAIPEGLELYVYGMMASLLAAALWLMVATYYGLPVSTTHSIVGAVLGFGIVVFWGNLELISWSTVGSIVASWVVSPLLSGTLAFVIFTFVQRSILYQQDMVAAAKRVAPFLVFLVFEVITLVTLWKGLKHLKLELTDGQAIVLASAISAALAFLSVVLLRRVTVPSPTGTSSPGQNPVIADELSRVRQRLGRLAAGEFGKIERSLGRISHLAEGDIQSRVQALETQLTATKDEVLDRLRHLEGEVQSVHTEVAEANGGATGTWGTPQMRATEKVFAYLQIISACSVAFAHGANDVANAVGPVSGVVNALQSQQLADKATLSQGWLLLILALGGLGIVIGLATWGWRVIETIGRKITELTPTRGFSAEFGAAVTILMASRMGLPISTTHTLVGAVLGVGFARGIGALNLRVVRDIVASWIITIPAGAGLAVIFFFLLRTIL